MTYCQRCGAELSPGSLKFLITIHVTADFDGALPTQVDEKDLEAFMRQIDQEDPVEVEKDVHQSQGYLVCPQCKAAFLEDPLATREEDEDGEEGGRVH